MTKDFDDNSIFETQEAEAPEENVHVLEDEAAQQAVEDWTAAQAVDESGENKKKPLHRKKAFWWLVCADSMMRRSVGEGLAFFESTNADGTEKPLQDLPVLTVAVDQGADGWSAVNWMLYRQQLSALVLCDSAHRLWNDYRLAVSGAGMWSIVPLFAVVLNLDCGPWSDNRWWQLAFHASKDYVAKKSRETCTLWQELWPQMCADKGRSADVCDEDWEAEMFKSLTEAFDTKLVRTATSRWFNWCTSSHKYLEMWHQRLLVYLYVMWCNGEKPTVGNNDLLKEMQAAAESLRQDAVKEHKTKPRRTWMLSGR